MDEEVKEYLRKDVVVEGFQVKNDVMVEVASFQKKLAKAGDWIVKQKDGKRFIVSAAEFPKKYFPLRGHEEG